MTPGKAFWGLADPDWSIRFPLPSDQARETITPVIRPKRARRRQASLSLDGGEGREDVVATPVGFCLVAFGRRAPQIVSGSLAVVCGVLEASLTYPPGNGDTTLALAGLGLGPGGLVKVGSGNLLLAKAIASA